ncbi:Putative acyl-CoA dehydrogenase FadE17 [Geodia barretti]|uniref:Acyl-CoA dehydrogenase FadE17 n=1 Tax=Geodia barretti TaxID=519541 RepID=A0AA35SL90_GEOBA|nr:Putative acyl-CoA dehydrogenase FadE17 [Geodia barretti]
MATKAYLLVETSVGKTREVATTLTGLPGIATVDVVTGPYDIIAMISADDISVVGDLVTGTSTRPPGSAVLDFKFTPEDEQFRQDLRTFLATELPETWEGGGRYPEEDDWNLTRVIRRKMADRGWLTMHWPEEYGGQGASPVKSAIFNEEIAYLRAPGRDIFGVRMLGPTLMIHGSEEQKRTHLPPVARGEVQWCQGYSEPESGSDLASLSTRAIRDGDDLVINGAKIWTTLAHRADYIMLLTRTDPDAPKHRGISFVLTKRNGQALMDVPWVRSLMADRYIECEVARLIAYNVAYMQGQGLVPTREASMSKVFGSETVRRVTEAAMDVLGLYGTLGREEKWAPLRGRVQEHWMLSFSGTIAAGTSEVQRNIIASRGLGLPRG